MLASFELFHVFTGANLHELWNSFYCTGTLFIVCYKEMEYDEYNILHYIRVT